MRRVEAGGLDLAYLEWGPAEGQPVVLLHGFPYDAHAFETAAGLLGAAGFRVLAPFLRGFGGTRFLRGDALRSGQQAALGQDLLDFMEALELPPAILGGFDWGGRAACIAAALWPQRVRGLVCDGYSIQELAAAGRPQPPEVEQRYWYQFYFHGERGRAGLAAHRRELCRGLWRAWSPDWAFDAATFERSAVAFDNPDFVEIVIHSYRHRFGLAEGDPALAELEAKLAALPPIPVPAITLHGGADTVTPPEISEGEDAFFLARRARRVLPGIGHNLPQEAPQVFADAVMEVAL